MYKENPAYKFDSKMNWIMKSWICECRQMISWKFWQTKQMLSRIYSYLLMRFNDWLIQSHKTWKLSTCRSHVNYREYPACWLNNAVRVCCLQQSAKSLKDLPNSLPSSTVRVRFVKYNWILFWPTCGTTSMQTAPKSSRNRWPFPPGAPARWKRCRNPMEQ